jgi:hypothetical protein
LHAFFEVIAFHIRRSPTRLAMRSVYQMAAQPPPDFFGRILILRKSGSRKGAETKRN